MWNSPHSPSKNGKRYALADISALVLPLDELLDSSKSLPIAELVEEAILTRFDRNEFVYALFQVFDALLEETALPEKGHPGFQEAMVAELLNQAHAQVCNELEDSTFGHSARMAVWRSVDRLLIQRDPNAPRLPWILEELGLDMSGPQPFLSEKLTDEVWHELLLGDGSLSGELLWDADWRVDSILDLHPKNAESVSQITGIDLDVVHALPHTPKPAEVFMAEHYIKYLIWKDEVTLPQDPGNA